MFVKLLAVTLVGLVVWAIAAHSSESAGRARIYAVRPNDTLWSIATKNYGGDPRDAVYRLERRNGLTGPVVRPGQRLVLP